MGGILDLFDDPNILQNLFGISGAQAKPAATPTPLPPYQGSGEPPLQGGGFGGQPVQTTSLGPPPGGAPPPSPPPSDPGAQFAPGQMPPMGAPIDPSRNQNGGPNMPFAARAQPIQQDIASGITDPQGGNYTGFDPNANQPQPPNMAPVVPSGGRPPMPQGPVQMADASGRVPIPAQPAPPPPPSVMAQPGGPPMTGTSGSLSASLGLNPNAMQIGLAGLGKGLSAVGAQRPGATAGAAFAAGAGGGLTGSNEQIERNQAQARQAQNDLFNQQSGYFKDMLAAKANDSTAEYRNAQAKWLLTRSQAQMTGGGAGNNVLNSPIGKVTWVEGQAEKYRDQVRKTAEKNATIKGEPIDEDAIEKATDTFRKKLYNLPQINMDPDKAEKIKNMGVEPPTGQDGKANSKFNPFDTRTMSEDDFNTHVPMGGWYLNQNGDPRQRTKPPPGVTPQAQSAPGGYPSADELMATSPV